MTLCEELRRSSSALCNADCSKGPLAAILVLFEGNLSLHGSAAGFLLMMPMLHCLVARKH